MLLTDTVGFIQKLPTQLIAAFRATLEEMEVATLLLHVVDITHHDAAEQALTVEETIDELGLGGKTRVTVLNKVDLALEGTLRPGSGQGGKRGADRAREFAPPAWAADGIPASAEKGWGLAEVRAAIEQALTESAERERAAAGRG